MPAWFVHPPMILVVTATIAGAIAMLTWRGREARRAVTVRSIVIPPLGMSTGFLMFIAPAMRLPLTGGLGALALGGVLFAIPLLRTSRLIRQGEEIFVARSRAFAVILLLLVAVRFGLRAWTEQYVSPLQTGALFFLLAFGAVVRWRLAMLRDYRGMMAPRTMAHITS
jgi:membrane protein CcdC involved in cytochrome C biogenesis